MVWSSTQGSMLSSHQASKGSATSRGSTSGPDEQDGEVTGLVQEHDGLVAHEVSLPGVVRIVTIHPGGVSPVYPFTLTSWVLRWRLLSNHSSSCSAGTGRLR